MTAAIVVVPLMWFFLKPIEKETEKLISNSNLLYEHPFGSIYHLTSESVMKRFKSVNRSTIDRTFIFSDSSLHSLKEGLGVLEAATSDFGAELTNLNIFLIPAEFKLNSTESDFYTRAYVKPQLGNENVFFSKNNPNKDVLYHEVAHFFWTRYFKGSKYEDEYLTLRDLDDRFSFGGAWDYNIEEVFAEDLGFILSGEDYADYPEGYPDWLRARTPRIYTAAPQLTKERADLLEQLFRSAVQAAS
ncbi:hypothetical protein [Ammoniphilus oxalaticus]|uniref:hypothetical protein n=1 Tax=Ammoniphilus oxalaticus TaxID=66863 RepID=UPI0011C3E1E8|nr:hypothetical protein [Ammoniphilus oxalaticus]